MSFNDFRDELRAKRKARDTLEREFQQLRETARTLLGQKRRLMRLGLEQSNEFQALLRRETEVAQRLEPLTAELTQARGESFDLLGRLVDFQPPQEAVRNLDDRLPILLLPVRLETRFRRAAPGESDSQNELWLRIYPDDIHVDTHEEILTEDEVASAREYWREVWRAGGEPERERAAWRVLIRQYGAPRAAFIVEQYRPNNELDANNQSNRPSAPLAEGEELDPPPSFDPYEPKQESWSRAPRAMALPDRFVAMGFRGSEKIFEQLGRPIPEPLIVGPDPAHPADENEGFKEDAEDLEVDGEMQWMVDFDEAVRVGMALRIPLGTGRLVGFDRLIVLGLRLSADSTEGQRLLEELIESHRYGEEGLSLVPQGTATNNTDSKGAGFASSETGDDESFEVEQGDPLFEPTEDWKDKRDGQFLAEALGIDPTVLQHLQHSDGFDQRDARAMNTALWPATLGDFLEEMMDPIFSAETIGQVRDFFVRFVSGRGGLPAIRVGDQPYGILPTSVLSRWRHIIPGVAPPMPSVASSSLSAEFELDLHNFLMKMDTFWSEQVESVARAGGDGSNEQQNLLDVLGLHASSVEFHQRFAISVEQAFNMSKLGDPSLQSFDADNVGALWRALLEDFDATAKKPEMLNKLFYKAQNALRGPLVNDHLPLSETLPLPELSEDQENYLEWLADSPMDTIRRQDFGERDGKVVQAPRALLYLMLRHAVMNAYWDSAWNFFASAQLSFVPPRREPSFLSIRGENPGQSKFSLLYRPAGELSTQHPQVFGDAQRTVAEQISTNAVIRNRPEAKMLREVREALECLMDRPTAALERAFAEHIDLCSYRLDAWQLGLVRHRLERHRSTVDHGQGIYLGAFGWLEDVHPKASPKLFEGEAPEEFCKEEDPPLQMPPVNGGYLHGPSLNHAVTAAVLRNAYLTHADGDNTAVTSVNLTSERVRGALSVIEGVRSGQELGALLGYQLERGLHDRHEEAEVDRFIFPLRRRFPLVSGRLNEAPDDAPIETLEARNVIDGLALVRHVQETNDREYPFGLSFLPNATGDQAEVIDSEVERLENTLDAVADLLLSEGVYQVVQGNYDRAGAALDALSNAETLPEPEITQTPRSGFAMVHRQCLQLENGVPPEGSTPRARAERGLNRWVAGLAGDLSQMVVRVIYMEGGEGEEVEHEHEVSMAELGLEPIDLLYLLDENLKSEESELDQRIALALRSREGLVREVPVRIEYSAAVSGKVTFFQWMPLLRCLKSLVLDARPLNAEDLVLPADESADLSPDAEPDPNPKGWDLAELVQRVEEVQKALAALRTELEAARFLLPGAGFAAVRTLLMRAAAFGLPQALPKTAVEETAQVGEELLSRAEAVDGLVAERLESYEQITNAAQADNELSEDGRVRAWIEAGRALLGADFQWIPTFRLKLPVELARARQDSEHILRHLEPEVDFPMDEWLHGLARVREPSRYLEQCMLLAEGLDLEVPELVPLQLPYRSDDFWLGMSYPPDYEFDAQRLLLATIFAAPLDVEAPQAGLLLDEWTEVVPTRNETTGIAFHYDAPNTEPPQSLLLAVSPDIDGRWRWDDLVDSVVETLDMAKKRAVEPQHLDVTRLAQFLPGIMVPATRYLLTVATNLLANMDKVAAAPPPGEGDGS